MTITSSGLLVPTWRDVLDATQLAVDLDAETHRIALFKNAVTPNFSADTAYGVAPYNANECSGTAYTAGGQLVTATTFTESPSGTLMWNCDDPDWASSTIADARAALIYADALAGNNGLMLIDFGAAYSTAGLAFHIYVATTGLFSWRLVP